MVDAPPNKNSLVWRVWSCFDEASSRPYPPAPSLELPPTDAEGFLDEANLALARGDTALAHEQSVRAVGRSIALGRIHTLRRALIADAHALLLRRELNAVQRIIEIIEAALDPNDLVAKAEVCAIRGWSQCAVATWGGEDYPRARSAFEVAEAIYRERADWPGVVTMMEGRAWTEAGEGEYFQALQTLHEAAAIAVREGVDSSMLRLAFVAAMAGKDAGYEEFGMQAFPKLIAWCEAVGDRLTLSRAKIGYASVLAYRCTTDPARGEAAQGCLRDAISLSGAAGLIGLEFDARTALILLMEQLGKRAAADEEENRMQEMAEKLTNRQVLELLYREREQQTIFTAKLRRQVGRLHATLESTEDAILVFSPYRTPEGTVDDFFCETSNDSALRLVFDGHAVGLLSEAADSPLLSGAGRMFLDCLETGEVQEDNIQLGQGRQVRVYVRRVVPALPGVAICVRDITEQYRAEQAAREAVNRSIEKSRALEEKQIELLAANRRLDHLAMTDGLTGVLNHRAFQERLDEEVHRSIRDGTPLSLVMVDVDHFKRFNDVHGHLAGDRALRGVAKALTEIARSYDPVARYGGEEFAVILPGADSETASVVADRMRAHVSHIGPEGYRVTASFGVATWSPLTPNPESLLASADRALFISKERGRNRVTHARELVSSLGEQRSVGETSALVGPVSGP